LSDLHALVQKEIRLVRFSPTQRDNIRNYINTAPFRFYTLCTSGVECIENTAVCILLYSCARTQIQQTNETEAETAESAALGGKWRRRALVRERALLEWESKSGTATQGGVCVCCLENDLMKHKPQSVYVHNSIETKSTGH